MTATYRLVCPLCGRTHGPELSRAAAEAARPECARCLRLEGAVVPVRVTPCEHWPLDLDPGPRAGCCRLCDRQVVEGDLCASCRNRLTAWAQPDPESLGDALARGEAPWAGGELAEQPGCLELVHRDADLVPPREPWMDWRGWAP